VRKPWLLVAVGALRDADEFAAAAITTLERIDHGTKMLRDAPCSPHRKRRVICAPRWSPPPLRPGLGSRYTQGWRNALSLEKSKSIPAGANPFNKRLTNREIVMPSDTWLMLMWWPMLRRQHVKFVLVNGRRPRSQSNYAHQLCCMPIGRFNAAASDELQRDRATPRPLASQRFTEIWQPSFCVWGAARLVRERHRFQYARDRMH
jgi:hypothetical protein